MKTLLESSALTGIALALPLAAPFALAIGVATVTPANAHYGDRGQQVYSELRRAWTSPGGAFHTAKSGLAARHAPSRSRLPEAAKQTGTSANPERPR